MRKFFLQNSELVVKTLSEIKSRNYVKPQEKKKKTESKKTAKGEKKH